MTTNIGEGEVVFNEPAMYREFQSWGGDVGNHIAKKGAELESAARISAGFDTGELIANIRTDYTHVDTGDLEAHTGVNPEEPYQRGYAFWHHEGTLPHQIVPVQAKVLRFVSHGTVVFAHRVWHPGTVPVKYLSRWLKELF